MCTCAQPAWVHVRLAWYVLNTRRLIPTCAQEDEESESESMQAKLAEALMVGLRLIDGVDGAWATGKYGDYAVQRALQALQEHVEAGLVEIERADGVPRRVRLTTPEGFLFSNTVLVSLFEVV